ncbi:hypothetical protein SAMN05216233_12524 [Desulfoluna spongiiphila]|uniref:Uncharacterized protein n=1 Tax=Desulfoluna spongiiphila TaxID=419481 RepID=A0A1G5J4Y7_9BACT|nr:hypothetical protein SAMN05216233_12524 [Desulfoluna spongiiphila]VVS93000.1 hypothetical protein DBB_25680 [Desulfoluna spongiiphila]
MLPWNSAPPGDEGGNNALKTGGFLVWKCNFTYG